MLSIRLPPGVNGGGVREISASVRDAATKVQ